MYCVTCKKKRKIKQKKPYQTIECTSKLNYTKLEHKWKKAKKILKHNPQKKAKENIERFTC